MIVTPMTLQELAQQIGVTALGQHTYRDERNDPAARDGLLHFWARELNRHGVNRRRFKALTRRLSRDWPPPGHGGGGRASRRRGRQPTPHGWPKGFPLAWRSTRAAREFVAWDPALPLRYALRWGDAELTAAGRAALSAIDGPLIELDAPDPHAPDLFRWLERVKEDAFAQLGIPPVSPPPPSNPSQGDHADTDSAPDLCSAVDPGEVTARPQDVAGFAEALLTKGKRVASLDHLLDAEPDATGDRAPTPPNPTQDAGLGEGEGAEESARVIADLQAGPLYRDTGENG